MTRFRLCMACLCVSAFSQSQFVPHVTPIEGNFSTTFVLINPDDAPLDYQLNPYSSDGVLLAAVTGTLEAGEVSTQSTTDLFGGDISHFTIEDGTNLEIAIAYRDAEQTGSSAHLTPQNHSAFRWLIVPGEGDDVVDGLAIVNLDAENQPIHVRQIDSNNTEIARETVLELDSNAKGLYLFQDFNKTPGTHFEVFSDGLLTLTALRFSTGSARYFWASAAIPLPALIEVQNTIPQILDQQALSITSGDSLTLTLDQLTIQDPDPGQTHTLFVANGANYTVNGTTITPDANFTGTLTVPVTVHDGTDESASYPLAVEVAAATDPRVGLSTTFPPNSTYGVSGRAVISDENTITLENFNYNGTGPDVRIYLGKNGDYANGIDLSGLISGTTYTNQTVSFPLPPGVTLDDFDGISVWCTIFLIDFSSGIFQ